ncbi:uncharacterized protein LOC124157326 [Ischnura elegans]|uniref:uncharacterized protein LOC124157326 n=1 Tax=Ischnura elegans TaxID=197161 RepID=UPI001ED8BCB7|nr:uncharacterized protein LOC124157326 [Ischnura elegans]
MAEGPRAYSRSAAEVRKSPAFEVRTCFANEPYRFDNFGDGRPIELTSLWEQVLKMRRLPSGLDKNALFRELSSRMGYPEWEVRQHALRVLADIAPVLPAVDVAAALDSPLLLPATVNCLGHPSAAVRRAALDALRALLVASEDPDLVVDALVLHGLDGTDPDVAMGVILGIPALLSPRLPHQGMNRLVSALARKVIHSAFHEEALDALSKIRSLAGEAQFDRFLTGFPPKYRRDFRALFRAHDMRSDNEDSSAETRARVKEMLANGILKDVEGQDTKRLKIEASPNGNPNGSGKTSKDGKGQPAATASGAAAGKSVRQNGKGLVNSVKADTLVEEEEIDSANGSRPASAETRTEEPSVSDKVEEPTKAEPLLKVPEKDEDDASTSENDKASVENVGKGAGDGGNVTDEEGGELEDDEDSGVEGSGGRGEEGNEGGNTSPPIPVVAGRVLLETEIQFSEATAITMTILEEADVASNDGDPGRVMGRGRSSRLGHLKEEFDPDVAIRVLDSSEEEGVGMIREVGRASAGRRVRFGGEMVLQTPDSAAETLEVPKTNEDESVTNSSEDQEAQPHPKPAKVAENNTKPSGAQFVSHIPVRVDPSRQRQKNGDGSGGDQDKSKKESSAPRPSVSAPQESAPPKEEPAETVVSGAVVGVEREGTRVEVTTEDSAKVKLEAEGTEVELVVQVLGGGEGAQNAAMPEVVKPELPIVLPMSASRVHSWEDLGIVDKQILVDIKNKEDWQARGRGTNILKTALRDPAVSAMLYQHLPEFLLFIEPLLEDRSIPVVTAALGAVRNIASAPALRPKLSSPAILRRLTASLCRRAAHTHVAIRAAAASAAKALMRTVGPRTVLPSLLTVASAPRAPGHRVRESALILTLHALLAFPSGDFDANDVARRTAPALADPKRRVRQAALECMAVLAQFVPHDALPLSLATERLRSRKAMRAMELGVAARLSRRRLPVVTTDGLILYALQIPPTASRGMPGTPTGADVDWILAGTGSISSGSAMSRGNYPIHRSDSPLMPTAGAHIPVFKEAPDAPPTLRNRPDSPIAWNHSSPWMDSRRNQSNLAPVVGPITPADQRAQSADTNSFTYVPLRGVRRSAPLLGSPVDDLHNPQTVSTHSLLADPSTFTSSGCFVEQAARPAG